MEEMRTLTDEEMEIENNRYTYRAFFVLPLSSGRIAVLHPNRSSFMVVDNWHSAIIAGINAEADQLANAPQRTINVDLGLNIDLGALDDL